MRRSKLYLSGIRLMAQSAVSFSIMGLCVKFASEQISPVEAVFFRSFFGVLMVIPIILAKKLSFWGEEYSNLTLRGLAGFGALILHFYTISKLELGLAIMLNYTAPIFTVILSSIFLKERPSLSLCILIAASFIGVSILTFHGTMTLNPNIWLALLSSVFASIAYLTIRTIRHKESPYTVIFYFTLICTIGSLFFLKTWTWPEPKTWSFIAGIVIASFYGQLWMTTALRRAPAYLATPFSYIHPMLSYFYGWFFWENKITRMTILGIFLIIVSGSLISYFETRK